jgi:glycosyltransferase involved in cell wall biosynthesis
MKIHLLYSGDYNALTGGFIYNKRIVEGLKLKGHEIKLHPLPGDFPYPSVDHRNYCMYITQLIPIGEPIIIDSIVFGIIPEILKELSIKNPIIGLIHLLYTVNPNYSIHERESLAISEKESCNYTSAMVATSFFTQQLLLKLRVNRNIISVILPGVDNYPRKTNYAVTPTKLLCVSNYTTGKGYLTLIKALTLLKDKDWEINCYGNQEFDPEYVRQIKSKIDENGLENRIHIHSAIKDKELSDAYLNADLLVHPSNFETYGMVLTEALAHGLPVVASTGGGIKETVPEKMGFFFTPGDANSLKSVLTDLMDNPKIYKPLCREASHYYKQQNNWENSISSFEQLIIRIVDSEPYL